MGGRVSQGRGPDLLARLAFGARRTRMYDAVRQASDDPIAKVQAMTRHLLTVSALCLLATACGPAPGLRPAGGDWGEAPAVSGDDYLLRDAAGFGLTGQESLAEAAAIVQSKLTLPDHSEGNYAETMKIYSGEIIGLNRGAAVFTQTGLPDDAVETEQHVIEFAIDAETGAAAATAFGTRQKCRRGGNPGVFTNKPCP